MVLYFWQNDSKDASDRAFGQVCTALRTASVVGIDELASVAAGSSTTQSGHGATATIVEPYAMSDWAKFLWGRYHVGAGDRKDSHYGALGIKASNIHCVVAVGDVSELSNEPVSFETHGGVQREVSLRGYVKRLASGRPGFVRCYTHPPLLDEEVDPAGYFDYCVWRSAPRNFDIAPRLPVPVTVAPDVPAPAPVAAPVPAAAVVQAVPPAPAAAPAPPATPAPPHHGHDTRKRGVWKPPPAKRARTAAAPRDATRARGSDSLGHVGLSDEVLAAAHDALTPAQAAKFTHTRSQVTTLGHNCWRKVHDVAFSADLLEKADRLYPGGVKGYDPSLMEALQWNVIARAPSPTALFPRAAFVNALNGRTEHYFYFTEPKYMGLRVLALDPQRGHSLLSGAGGGAAGALELEFGGPQNVRKVPRIADLIRLVANQNGVDLATPSRADEAVETACYGDLVARKSARDARRRAQAPTGPRSPLDFWKVSKDYVATKGVSPSDAFKKLDVATRGKFETLSIRAILQAQLLALEDEAAGVDATEA